MCRQFIALSLLLAVALLAPFGATAEDHEPDPPPTPSLTATVAENTAVPATLTIPTATPTKPPTPQPTATPAPTATAVPKPTDGLTLIGDGPAAYYARAYDQGGWDAIIQTHIGHGQGDAKSFPYSPQGYYCVHPDFVFGNILTLQNPKTGVTIRCTIADAVAPWDVPTWRSRWQVELSTAAFDALGLNGGNRVTVWAKR